MVYVQINRTCTHLFFLSIFSLRGQKYRFAPCIYVPVYQVHQMCEMSVKQFSRNYFHYQKNVSKQQRNDIQVWLRSMEFLLLIELLVQERRLGMKQFAAE